MKTDTRERLVAAGADLILRQGLAATGIKQILDQADARFSSLYHHFPGGKNELAAEVVRTAGAAYQQHVEMAWDAAGDPILAMGAIFHGAAAALEASDYADACPIATVALEVASTNEPLRAATAEVFAAWLNAGRSRLTAAGLDEPEAEKLAYTIITALEGGFVLSRAAKSTDAMLAAGDAMTTLVRAALAGNRAPAAPPKQAHAASQ